MTNIYIPNQSIFEEKLQKIKIEGLSRLQIIADFDGTLTGQSSVTSWSIFKTHFGEEYTLKRQALFDEYYPIERDNSLDGSFRKEQMSIWWKKHLQLLIDNQLTLSILKNILEDQNIKFRDGVIDLFNIVNKNNVPLLIFSAGIGDAIKIYLEVQNLKTPNVHILSNFFKLNPDGNIVGFEKEVVHALNKNESLIKDEPYFAQVLNRPNCILFGDSLHDASMSDGIPHSTVLRIGFLNGKENEKEVFEKIYDVIIKKDTDIFEINKILFS